LRLSLVDVKVRLFDGSYHSVDSSEMAFKIAGSMALKKAVQDARPVLLEPIMKVEVIVPEDTLGSVIGRSELEAGKVQGVDAQAGGNQKVEALVPMSEMLVYANQLQEHDLGRGLYSMEFSPLRRGARPLAQKIVAERQKQKSERSNAAPWKKPWSGGLPRRPRESSSTTPSRSLMTGGSGGMTSRAASPCHDARQTGIIPEADAGLIVQGLQDIARDIEEGAFTFREDLEDVHMNIEAGP